MKMLLLVLLPTVLMFAGCENACEKGQELKTKLQSLETQVAGTIVTPGNFGLTCTDVQKTWSAELARGADFAARVAHDYFYSEERSCVRWHYRQECWTDTVPSGSMPDRRVCRNVYVCDAVHVIPHKSDGYEQAMELSSLLLGSQYELNLACAAHDKGADAEALMKLASVKYNLGTARSDAEYVLTKAGCYERRGD